MAYPTRKTILAALALSFACDSGHVIHASIILPKAIAAAYTPKQRGLLVASFSHVDGGQRRNIAVVCGDTTTFETEFSGDGERKESTIQAWILADATGPAAPPATTPTPATARATSPRAPSPSTPPPAASRTAPRSRSPSPSPTDRARVSPAPSRTAASAAPRRPCPSRTRSPSRPPPAAAARGPWWRRRRTARPRIPPAAAPPAPVPW
jgi:hypothetical protein